MSAQAACIVGDRSHLADVRQACEHLGGAWLEGARLWESTPEMSYVVLLANNPRRIACGAPLLMFAADATGLRMAIKRACQSLDDITCMWVRLIGPEAQGIIDPIVLADVEPKGSA